MKTTIRDLAVGNSGKYHLLLKEFSIKQTKANKNYLYAVFTDGVDTLTGQDWDWEYNPSIMPGLKLATGCVYEIAGSISEYQGNKQIKLVRIDASPLDAIDFAPSGGVNVEHYMEMFDELRESIQNATLRNLVDAITTDYWDEFKTLPAAVGVHHAYAHGLLQHSVDVARKAKAVAEITNGVDVDLVTAGGLLHDIGKVRTYRLNGALIEMTEEGQMIEHIMLGAMILDKYRTPENNAVVDLLLHIISSHHGKLEYGSPTTPRTLEAMLVSSADGIDAATRTVIETASKTKEDADWTGKVWAQSNRPMLTPLAVQRRLGNQA